MNAIELKKDKVFSVLEILMKYVVKCYKYCLKDRELSCHTEEKYLLPKPLKDTVKRVVVQMKDSPIVEAYRRLYNEKENCNCRTSYMLELYEKGRTDLEFVVEVIKACAITAALSKEGYGYSPDFIVDRIRVVCFANDKYEAFRNLGCEEDHTFAFLNNLMKFVMKHYKDCVEGKEFSSVTDAEFQLPKALLKICKDVVVQMKDSPLVDMYLENRVCRCANTDYYLHEFFVEDENFTDLEFVVEVIKFCVVAAALFEDGCDEAPNFVVKVILKVCFDNDEYKAFRVVGCDV